MSTSARPGLTALAIAFSTPAFLGVAPIFGKLAIQAGADSFSVAALRTILAVAILWAIYGLFFRKAIFIYPAGLLGCVVIGVINGIGSLFYYGSLSLLDASLAQLLNGMYLAFAVMLSTFAGQRADPRTILRVGLALLALVFLAGFGTKPIDWVGVGLMLGSALMFAGTMILSQYVLYEMPARTVTLYVLTTMGVVVSMVWLAVGNPLSGEVLQAGALPVIALGVTTALSRLAMFAGVKILGGMQTAILAIMEIGVALILAFIVLGERLTPMQGVGVGLLLVCLLLIRQSDLLPRGFNPSALIVANMADVQFQRIAFHRAFGTRELDNELGTMGAITTQEILAIQKMMGAENGGVDPFPIGKTNQLLTRQYDEQDTIPSPAPKEK
ncbi:MAG: DMT family transporter [Anaerolineae bacterium]|jgi:drug/metabolite transporter (DMT)-like permease|nr:DMT family transporter [Anaerolineae bacterium]